MKPELIALARASLLLASAPEPVARAVLAEAHVRHFDRGATIFLQGERARAIYIVAEGWVKLYRIAPNGTEAVIANVVIMLVLLYFFLARGRISLETPETRRAMLAGAVTTLPDAEPGTE